MKKRQRNTLFIIGLSLLGVLSLVYFIFLKEPVNYYFNQAEPALATVNEESIKHHEEKVLTASARIFPFPKINKHPSSKNIEELAEKIESVLEHDYLFGTSTGVSVRNSEGEIIYSSNGDLRLVPASNMKLITSVAALHVLGPEYRFSTDIRIDGEIKDGVLNGDLYLVGKGDPTVRPEDYEALAEDIKNFGITKIEGSIYADDTWYDDVRYSQDLSWQHEKYYYGNATSALNVAVDDDYLLGSVIVDIFPADKVGEKPIVTITPNTNYVKVINRARTVGAGQPFTLNDYREHGNNTFIIEGDLPTNIPHYQRWRAVWEPTGFVLSIFSKGLEKAGVEFSQEKVAFKRAPKNANTIVTRNSIPLKEIIVPFNRASNNGIGEVFVKEMGKVSEGEGSWEAGLKAMKQALGSLGLRTDIINLRDGSGMSSRNLVSANFFTDLLVAAEKEPWYADFEHSLPVAGMSDPAISGTLRYRLGEESTRGNVKAKTGSLHKISTLSGYVTTKDGTKLSFSILINNFLASQVTHLQDEIVLILAEANLK